MDQRCKLQSAIKNFHTLTRRWNDDQENNNYELVSWDRRLFRSAANSFSPVRIVLTTTTLLTCWPPPCPIEFIFRLFPILFVTLTIFFSYVPSIHNWKHNYTCSKVNGPMKPSAYFSVYNIYYIVFLKARVWDCDKDHIMIITMTTL